MKIFNRETKDGWLRFKTRWDMEAMVRRAKRKVDGLMWGKLNGEYFVFVQKKIKQPEAKVYISEVRRVYRDFFMWADRSFLCLRFSKTVYSGNGRVFLLASQLDEGKRRYYLWELDNAKKTFVRCDEGHDRRYDAVCDAMTRTRVGKKRTVTLSNGMQVIWPPNLPLPERASRAHEGR